MTVLAVIGAQYGSEGKGVIVHHLANKYDVHVRVGGPNAGHSFYEGERLWKMQMLPCGWTNKEAYLVIGRGAVVDLAKLREEADAVPAAYNVYDRLLIDANAFVLAPVDKEREGGVEGELHARIGSTGEGVGEARIARLRRYTGNGSPLVRDRAAEFGLANNLHADTPAFLRQMRMQGKDVLLEGTQGVGLSLVHGPWPYVTSADTGAAQLAADCGVPASHLRVLAVGRTLPIRVAGNSGPFAGRELSWAEVSQRIGRDVEERTTVTRKVRRIAEWSDTEIWRTVITQAPDFFAIMFLDYLFPKIEGCADEDLLAIDNSRSPWGLPGDPTPYEWLLNVEQRFGVPVKYVGTGGPRFAVIER